MNEDIWTGRLRVAEITEDEALRALVRQELQISTERAVAKDAKVSRSSLRKFVAGAVPRPDTRRQLEVWRRGLEGGVAHAPHPGTAGIALITAQLPTDVRVQARRELAELVAEIYTRAGVRVPGWVEEELRGGL